MTIKIISKGNSADKPESNVRAVRVMKKKKEPTILQEKVIKITKKALLGNVRKSKGGIMREAGYSPGSANQPNRVFDSPAVKDELSPVIAQMRKIRSKALEALEGKDMGRESAFNLTMISGMLTKDSELLDGRPTSREVYELPEDEKARIRKLLKKNS